MLDASGQRLLTAISLFTFDHLLADPDRLNTENSRFVLYDNGAFVLQYQISGGQYRGSYTAENGVLNFKFESNLGQWTATGRLEGDSLEVKYNRVMHLDDFEDAAYRRMP